MFSISPAMSGTLPHATRRRTPWDTLVSHWRDRRQRRIGRTLQRIQDEHVRSLRSAHAGVRFAAVLAPQGERLSSMADGRDPLNADQAVVDGVCAEAARRSKARWQAGHAATPIFPTVLGNALCRRVSAGSYEALMLIVLDPRVGDAHAHWLGRYAARELSSQVGLAL